MTRQNRFVLRSAMLVFVFVASVWATAARAIPASPDAAMTLAGADTCAHLDSPMHSPDSDGQWIARQQANASVTESVWKSSLVHAELAGARCSELFVTIQTAVGLDHRRHRPASAPLRIPLLI